LLYAANRVNTFDLLEALIQEWCIMGKETLKKQVIELFESADIYPNRDRPWDIQIHNPDFYSRVLNGGSLALGESYMDGWWDCNSLDQFFEQITRAKLEDKVKSNLQLLSRFIILKFANLQTKKNAFNIAKTHYNLGNTLFEIMLDSRLIYSCAYWKNADNLEDAQLHKLDLICKKLLLAPGMRLLDIGCGFGALAIHAAKNYGADVVGITVSKEQYDIATQRAQGLPVKIQLSDYRDLEGRFDRVVSVGMFEHVGPLNYREYMQKAHDCLTEDGLFLLHTIGSNTSNVETDAWINKYIFPNSVLPSVTQISEAFKTLFIMEDWHNFGADYDKTLMAWRSNFEQGWDMLKADYDERFYRMWCYYLSSCAGLFRAREIQLWQIVLSKHGVEGGYQSLR